MIKKTQQNMHQYKREKIPRRVDLKGLSNTTVHARQLASTIVTISCHINASCSTTAHKQNVNQPNFHIITPPEVVKAVNMVINTDSTKFP
jgi:hypothetical protein